jgi:hypothetical protein
VGYLRASTRITTRMLFKCRATDLQKSQRQIDFIFQCLSDDSKLRLEIKEKGRCKASQGHE